MQARTQSHPNLITCNIDIPPRSVNNIPQNLVVSVNKDDDGAPFNVLITGMAARLLETYYRKGMVVQFEIEEVCNSLVERKLPDNENISFICSSAIQFLSIRRNNSQSESLNRSLKILQ